jgi:hypothetical protein
VSDAYRNRPACIPQSVCSIGSSEEQARSGSAERAKQDGARRAHRLRQPYAPGRRLVQSGRCGGGRKRERETDNRYRAIMRGVRAAASRLILLPLCYKNSPKPSKVAGVATQPVPEIEERADLAESGWPSGSHRRSAKEDGGRFLDEFGNETAS